jgi:nucleotide-binding universal stress UspA family protein
MPFALEQAAETGAKLILLHVLSVGVEFEGELPPVPFHEASGAMNIAGQMLQSWCDAAIQCGIQCDGLVREGHISYQIAAAFRQFHADRVLLGARNQSKLGRLQLGSVAEQVLRSVYSPVLTVGPEAHLPVDAGEERVVLHATTLRETSRPGAVLACQAAEAHKARLVLLHVLPPAWEMEGLGLATGANSEAMRELQQLANEIRILGCPAVEPVVAHGNPAIEILALSAERKASQIILGASHQPAFENLTRERTLYRVLAGARCPVLSLHVPQFAAEEAHTEAAAAHG